MEQASWPLYVANAKVPIAITIADLIDPANLSSLSFII